MTLRYVRNGDGYIVHSRERAVCVVHTKTSEFLPAHRTPDGRDVPDEVVERHLPQSEWQFHFYHGFYTPPMLKELIDLLPKAEPDNGRPAAGVQLRSAAESDERRRLAMEAEAAAIRNTWVPPDEEGVRRPGDGPNGPDPRAPQDATFVLSPEDEAKRRSILEHHERAIKTPPAAEAPPI